MHVDRLPTIAENQNGINLFALSIWHFDVLEGCFFRDGDGTKQSED
jgi:hypothetical protein